MPGHLAENILHFARILRAAGVPVGTERALRGVEAWFKRRWGQS